MSPTDALQDESAISIFGRFDEHVIQLIEPAGPCGAALPVATNVPRHDIFGPFGHNYHERFARLPYQ